MASRKVHREKSHDLLDFFHVDQNAWPYEPEIDKLVMDLINPEDRDRVPGVAVAVRRNQQVVHVRGYGYANLETGARITPDTIFDLGSLSKQFTALAILDLVIKKKIAQNDPLSKFFKGFPRYADSITVEDLLHHTSGLPDYTKLHVDSRQAEEDWYDKAMAKPDNWYPRMLNKRRKEITNKDVVQWIASQILLAKDPETEFDYSNSGYVVLAELVARVSKKPFAQYLKETLFSDMMMKDTYVFDEVCRFSPRAREIVNHAKCYNRVSGHFVPVGYTPLNFINGDGNVHSTIKDLLRWELSLSVNDIVGLCSPTDAEKFGGGHIIRDLLWSPVHIKKGKQVNYGAGWHLRKHKYEEEVKVNGRRAMRKYESRAEFHRGEWLGWRGYFARGSRWPVPKAGKNVDPNSVESLGIVVLSNAVFGDKEFTTCRIAQGISQFYWGKWKKDNIMNNFNCG
jgi:CubicO group peptidase (beta-lactamase class C family)